MVTLKSFWKADKKKLVAEVINCSKQERKALKE